MANEKGSNTRYKVLSATVVLLALLCVPAPLLPPHRFAEAIQSMFGINWKMAYLIAAIILQTVFFGSIGTTAAFVVKRTSILRGQLIQIVVVPFVIVFVAFIIRSAKMGYFPFWINAAIPIVACMLGVWIGLALIYKRGKIIFFILLVVTGSSFWLLTGGHNAALTRATENHLKLLVVSGSVIPPDTAKFAALLKLAFAPVPAMDGKISAVQQNRSAILALGIALGDESLAKFVGLKSDTNLLQQAAMLRNGTTIRNRPDWPRHFCLSAALAVLEHPFVSDAGGLMKEQLDALTIGSGFSFCDFAADRAGVRFANAATNSEADAKAMQDLLMKEFVLGHFFPPVGDLPENLTTEQFRREYGSVGSKRYHQEIMIIENRLDSCIALSSLRSGQGQK